MYHSDREGFHPQAVEQRASVGPGWTRQYETERVSAMPNLLHKDLWLTRREWKRNLGPGSHNLKDFLQILSEKRTSNLGICEPRAPRFEPSNTSITPGPGTYGKNGIPQLTLEEKARKSASTKGMLEASLGYRGPHTVGCRLGPGTYEFSYSIDKLLKKMTGIRGPYDLFSGNRNKPIPAGHFAAPKPAANLGPGQHELKSFLDEWDKDGKKHKGRFSTVAQYPFPPSERIFNSVLAQCPRDQRFPAPGAHDPPFVGQWPKPRPSTKPNKRLGFLSGSVRVDRKALRMLTGNYNHVGVGRYRIQKCDAQRHINAHRSVFQSVTGMPDVTSHNIAKERLRPKAVPVSEKGKQVTPQGLPCEQRARHLYTFNGQKSATQF